ncbi:hypothetical protein TNCV_2578581 [Trichonephila clavipes]|nr:hypothetical protein TNCV_2578581 [Trichonephila clavipes]
MELNRQVRQIGESLVIWVEAMQPFEDAGQNGWTMTDFSVMRVAVDLEPQQIGRTNRLSDQLSFIVINHQTCDLHTSVHHDPSQFTDRAKFTLVPTATSPVTHSGTLSSQITVVLGSIRLESG